MSTITNVEIVVLDENTGYLITYLREGVVSSKIRVNHYLADDIMGIEKQNNLLNKEPVLYDIVLSGNELISVFLSSNRY